MEPGYCPYQAGFASSAEAAAQVVEGDYIPLKSLTGSKTEIGKRIAEVNQYHGADKAQIAAMEAGSLFGWHIPAANPNMYDENGLPRKRKKENHRDEQT